MTDCDRKRRNINSTQKYTKTEVGLITKIYAAQRHRSKKRGHPFPSYSKVELTLWLYDNGFKYFFELWESSQYSKDKVPSVDRLDDYKPYTINNIKLGTWKDNNDRYSKDVIAGVNTKHCKAVNKLTVTGEFIKRYYSMAEASKATGVGQPHISQVCNGKRKVAGGFVWEFSVVKVDPYIGKYNYKSEKGNTRVAVVQLDMLGVFIKEFPSQVVAAKEVGIGHSHITTVCTGKRKSTGGFRWMFKKDYKKVGV